VFSHPHITTATSLFINVFNAAPQPAIVALLRRCGHAG
jgi:hypothetical protein